VKLPAAYHVMKAYSVSGGNTPHICNWHIKRRWTLRAVWIEGGKCSRTGLHCAANRTGSYLCRVSNSVLPAHNHSC